MAGAISAAGGIASAAMNALASGAKGDGSTPDSSSIQSTVTAAAAASTRIVYIPDTPNGYVFNSTVTVPSGVIVLGDNRKGLRLSRIKPAPGFTGPLFQTAGYGSARQLYCGLVGLCLDGSSTTLTAAQMQCQQSLFRDLTVLNCWTYGLQIGGVGSGTDQQALNNMIDACYFSGQSANFYDGIFLDYHTADTTISRTYVEYCGDANIRSRGYNDMIHHNHCYTANYGYYSESSADKGFSSNYVENQAIAAVAVSGGGADVGCLNATIADNRFRNINTGGTSQGVIVLSGSNMGALTIIGNTVRRDGGTSYSTPYFVYRNGVTLGAPDTVTGNTWASGVVTSGQIN